MYFKKIDQYYWKSEVNYSLAITNSGDLINYCIYDNRKEWVGKCKTFEGAVRLASTHYLLNNDD